MRACVGVCWRAGANLGSIDTVLVRGWPIFVRAVVQFLSDLQECSEALGVSYFFDHIQTVLELTPRSPRNPPLHNAVGPGRRVIALWLATISGSCAFTSAWPCVNRTDSLHTTMCAKSVAMYDVMCPSRSTGQRLQKAGVVPFPHCRGHCIPLWAVFPPLQVVLSSACFVANLSRYPSHYLPGHPHLREDALAAYPFGQGSPSTWPAGRTAVRDTPSATPPIRSTERHDPPRMLIAPRALSQGRV